MNKIHKGTQFALIPHVHLKVLAISDQEPSFSGFVKVIFSNFQFPTFFIFFQRSSDNGFTFCLYLEQKKGIKADIGSPQIMVQQAGITLNDKTH